MVEASGVLVLTVAFKTYVKLEFGVINGINSLIEPDPLEVGQAIFEPWQVQDPKIIFAGAISLNRTCVALTEPAFFTVIV